MTLPKHTAFKAVCFGKFLQAVEDQTQSNNSRLKLQCLSGSFEPKFFSAQIRFPLSSVTIGLLPQHIFLDGVDDSYNTFTTYLNQLVENLWIFKATFLKSASSSIGNFSQFSIACQ
ncbi:Uncharacterised protein [Rodentibacter pneumotropicus]|uniref:Uncharacterized protein n=1 Tax=Rodentibacter pneumotropicus TaxID=758 RepID=A0A448ML89_9PAST|nr:Uncharacterised protein [Rodentibacter pneumotropicus]